MTASVATSIDPRKLLVSGGVSARVPHQRAAGSPRAAEPAPPPAAVRPAQPDDDTPSAWEDWHVEVLGATWMRTPT